LWHYVYYLWIIILYCNMHNFRKINIEIIAFLRLSARIVTIEMLCYITFTMKYKIINVTFLSFALTSITLYNDKKSNKINKYHQYRKYCCIHATFTFSIWVSLPKFFLRHFITKSFFYFPKIYTHTMHSVHIVLFIRPERFGIFQFSDTFNVPSARTCTCVCVCVTH